MPRERSLLATIGSSCRWLRNITEPSTAAWMRTYGDGSGDTDRRQHTLTRSGPRLVWTCGRWPARANDRPLALALGCFRRWRILRNADRDSNQDSLLSTSSFRYSVARTNG